MCIFWEQALVIFCTRKEDIFGILRMNGYSIKEIREKITWATCDRDVYTVHILWYFSSLFIVSIQWDDIISLSMQIESGVSRINKIKTNKMKKKSWEKQYLCGNVEEWNGKSKTSFFSVWQTESVSIRHLSPSSFDVISVLPHCGTFRHDKQKWKNSIHGCQYKFAFQT